MPKNEFYDFETNEFLGEMETEEMLDLKIGDTFTFNDEKRRIHNLNSEIVTGDKKLYIK